MAHSAALLFGRGVPAVCSEEESVAQMIRKYFSPGSSPSGRSGAPRARRGSVDSCDENEGSPVGQSDVYWEQEDQLLQLYVTRRVERCLTEAKASTLQCRRLLLPRLTSTRVGLDVVRCSADEPCGLRGASIRLYVEWRGDGLKPAGHILPDPSVTPTFELSVVFRADEDSWPHLGSLLKGGKALKLKPEYRLVKRKLYSSASPVVQDRW